MLLTEEQPEAEQPKEVRDFLAAYAEKLKAARISEEHTATAGWQDLYGNHRDTITKARETLADQVGEFLKTLRMRLLTEGEEKDFGDVKKALTALRDLDQAFTMQVITPIMACMVECQKVIDEAHAAARDAHRGAPLHTRGLLEKMDEAINSVPRVKFVTSSGRLIVG